MRPRSATTRAAGTGTMSAGSKVVRLYRENRALILVDYTGMIVVLVLIGLVATATGETWLWAVAILASAGFPALTPRWTLDGEPVDAPWSGWLWERYVSRYVGRDVERDIEPPPG